MLPRWHALLGGLFILLIWIFMPSISVFYLSLVFLASFLIDFDHYANSVIKTGRFGLKSSFDYHKEIINLEKEHLSQGLRKKGDFHLFHTVEFHALIGLLSIIWIGFFYVFVGMIFHSFLDVFSMLRSGVFHRREFFFFNWIKSKKANNSFRH